MSVHANTKAWGETQTALTPGAVGTSYTVVRYFSVHGDPQVVEENSHSWVVARFTARAALGLPLQLNGGGRRIRDPVHADDIAAATGTPPASARWRSWSPSGARESGSRRRRGHPVARCTHWPERTPEAIPMWLRAKGEAATA